MPPLSPFTPSAKTLETLGKKNGYQYLWKEAEASLKDTLAQFTFLNNRTFYTISTLVEDSASIFFTRIGASWYLKEVFINWPLY